VTNKNDRHGEAHPLLLIPDWSHQPGPGLYINSTAVSADGSKIVAGTFFHNYGRGTTRASDDDKTYGTYCYDRKGRLLWSNEFQGWEGVYWVALSADGGTAASGGWRRKYTGFIRAFSASDPTGTPILDHPTGHRTNAVALSDDGSVLVAAADHLYAFTLSAVGSQGPDRFEAGSDVSFVTLSLSRDGRWAVAGDSKGAVYLLEIESGKWRHHLRWQSPDERAIHCVQISGDGKWFVAGGPGYLYAFKNDHSESKWRQTSDLRYAWKHSLGSGGAVYGVAISDNGDWVSGVANAGRGGVIHLVKNHGTAGYLEWSKETAENPNSTSLDSRGRYVTAADGHSESAAGHFYLWDRATGASLGVFATQARMSWPMFLSADGSTIAAGSDNSTVYRFSTPTG